MTEDEALKIAETEGARAFKDKAGPYCPYPVEAGYPVYLAWHLGYAKARAKAECDIPTTL